MDIALTQLEPEWVTLAPSSPDAPRGGIWRRPVGLAEAQGVLFLCPVCFEANGGPAGTHSVLCWFRGRGVPDDVMPGPGRWAVEGTGFDDLTLTPSVDTSAGGEGVCGRRGGERLPGWHGWVRAGRVT